MWLMTTKCWCDDYQIKMDGLVWSLIGNSTEVSENGLSDAATSDSAGALSTTSSSPANQSVSPVTVAAIGFLIAGVGICANSVVLAVLIRARRQFGSSVHTLIANQTAMDLFASVSGMVTLIVMLKHGYKYGNNRILDGTICMIFEEH